MPIMYGAVGAPSTTSAADGANQPVLQGKSGEFVATELHGKWYTSTYRGKTFIGSTAAAGVTIPASNATAATFALYNPLGSGVNMELVSLQIGDANATMVVNTLGLGLISGLLVAPTALTAIAPLNALLGGASGAQGKIYSAATLAAAASAFYWMFNVGATTGAFPNFGHEFDGRVILAPGSLVHLVGSVAVQTNATPVTAVWTEYAI